MKLILDNCNIKDLICCKEYSYSKSTDNKDYKSIINNRFNENYIVFCDTSDFTVLAAKTKMGRLKIIMFDIISKCANDCKEDMHSIILNSYDDLYNMKSIEI